MPESIDLGHAVTLPPRRAIDYFKSKGYETSWNWWEVWQEQHAKAFTVAKAARLDVLASIRVAQQRALSEGLTERQFAAELTPRLRAQGWWGRQFVDGPGGLEEAQLGSPWRLKNIYRTNTLNAYNVGRYTAQRDNTAARPYWQYLQIQRETKRPSHAIFHKRVFAADDPIWDSIYPPNGFGCSCRVRALTPAQVESLGLGVESSAGKLGRAQAEVGIDKRTGEAIERETTTFTENGTTYQIDPGFAHNPGKTWSLWDRNGAKPTQFPGDDALAGALKPLPDQKRWSDYGRPDLRDVPDTQRLPAPEILEAGAGADEAQTILAQALGIVDKPQRVVDTPVSQIALRRELLTHIAKKDRGDTRERYANYLIPTLETPYEVYVTEYADGFREHYIGLFEDRAVFMVARINPDGSIVYTAIPAKDKKLNTKRYGTLVWAKAEE